MNTKSPKKSVHREHTKPFHACAKESAIPSGHACLPAQPMHTTESHRHPCAQPHKLSKVCGPSRAGPRAPAPTIKKPPSGAACSVKELHLLLLPVSSCCCQLLGEVPPAASKSSEAVSQWRKEGVKSHPWVHHSSSGKRSAIAMRPRRTRWAPPSFEPMPPSRRFERSKLVKY